MVFFSLSDVTFCLCDLVCLFGKSDKILGVKKIDGMRSEMGGIV